MKNSTDRQHPRKAARRAYVEYSKASTRLSRIFRPSVMRGPMVDISRNGVQFRTTEPLEVGEDIYMTLRFPDIREAVKLKAQVRWSREENKVGIENYTHLIGAEFTELTPRGWDLIASAMKE